MSLRDERRDLPPVPERAVDAAMPNEVPGAAPAATARPWRRLSVVATAVVIVALTVALVVTNLRISGRPALSSGTAKAIAKAQSNAAISGLESAPSTGSAVYSEVRAGLVVIETDRTHGSADFGSGFIVESQGEIMTALHVVEGASAIKVVFADGTTSAASIASADEKDDIAVLVANKLPAVVVPEVLGGNAVVGDDVFAIGNPVGLVGSMSAGVVSGLDRSFSPSAGHVLNGLIQFDAAVNPGNSGGPLLNTKGQVIGVVEGLANPSGADSFAGIGFAVPIASAGGTAGEPPK